jgi:hypothetical protein
LRDLNGLTLFRFLFFRLGLLNLDCLLLRSFFSFVMMVVMLVMMLMMFTMFSVMVVFALISFCVLVPFMSFMPFVPFTLFPLVVRVFLDGMLEGLGNVSNGSPIFRMFSLLSSHFDEEAPIEYFFVEGAAYEVDGINSSFEDNLEGSRVIFFDFDEVVVREGLFNILLNCRKITFDQVERDVFNIILHTLDLVNEVLLLGEDKSMLLLLLLSLHQYRYLSIIDHLIPNHHLSTT